jgi:hypothetical protein
MAGGTGGHIFSCGITRARRALAFTEKVPVFNLGSGPE